jgi:hypothetical protein
MDASQERELLEFARRLQPYREIRIRPAFRARLRASLLATPAAAESPLAWWPRAMALRPIAVAILVLVLLAAVGGGAAAAASLPGDPAFAIKRAVEDVQVALASDDVSRLDTLLAQEDRRLADLETLSARRASAAAVAANEYAAAAARLDAMLARVTGMPEYEQRDEALARAAAKSADHLSRLEALAAWLPDAAQPGIQRAIEVQERVHGKSDSAPGKSETPNAPSPKRGGPPSGRP